MLDEPWRWSRALGGHRPERNMIGIGRQTMDWQRSGSTRATCSNRILATARETVRKKVVSQSNNGQAPASKQAID